MLSAAAIAVLALLGGGTAATQLRPKARARRRARRALRKVQKEHRAVERVRGASEGVLDLAAREYAQEAAERRLAGVPVDELRSFGAEKVRWGVLRDAGLETVADVKPVSGRALVSLDGIGKLSARRILQARRRLLEANQREPAALPAVGQEGDEVVELLRSTRQDLRTRDALAQVAPELAAELQQLDDRVRDIRRRAALLFGLIGLERPGEEEPVVEAADRVVRDVREMGGDDGILTRSARVRKELRKAKPEKLSPEELRQDHEERFADYCAVMEGALARASGTRSAAGPVAPGAGGLPQEIVERVEALDLVPAGLRLTLRGYQAFGAKYMLVQARTLLGDEMGLGKTIQTLAVFCHLLAKGEGARFLVVAPASIVHNWLRETVSRTDIPAHLLHGDEREQALLKWLADGGLAVTSFGTLSLLALSEEVAQSVDVLVVDEAHYVKNPEANRTRAISDVAQHAGRVVFLTGTPIENRLSEFRNLVGLLQPEVAHKLGEEAPAATQDLAIGRRAFGDIVAPVYLRRNQTDVLRELPARIDKDEWVELNPSDDRAYREAVEARDIMAMRRAATLGAEGAESAKMERLKELIEEHAEAGAKVLIFTFFLDVLDALEAEFDVHGRISGDVPAADRAALVDSFTTAEAPAILIAQITAGGVGLNIQAASVVVLMEPQWKPSSEEQAIARAHRMGQTRAVVVHRLFAKDSVDERMLEALGEKRELFDSFARGSRIKDASPHATEATLVKQVIEVETRRLAETAPATPPVEG